MFEPSPKGVYDMQLAMETFPVGSMFWTMSVSEGRLTTVAGPYEVLEYLYKTPPLEFLSGQRIVYKVEGGYRFESSLGDMTNIWHGMFADEESARQQAKVIGVCPVEDDDDFYSSGEDYDFDDEDDYLADVEEEDDLEDYDFDEDDFPDEDLDDSFDEEHNSEQ